jgi:glycine betaine/proline transport system permease protein
MAAAQTVSENPGITDNQILDQWVVPFGEWIDQMVDWIDLNLGWLLKIIEWPFTFLLDNLVDNLLLEVSWIWVVLAFFVIASLVRTVKVGLFAMAALTFCGLLGNDYWIQTARTIGFVLVAVLLCVLIGIPLGVACGRVDSVWSVVRPALDAMQVVHSFVYMLPFIFFFGIGEEAATMVTMVFALPPLIRLTNLGIRQVPEDVVEAARAFGAPESRVLLDVQLPLARPAIMTGLNQTLLLAISMLGIAAIMGAAGLGLLLFRAINNQDPALAASAGLAFFLVAVVLDRISQPEEGDGAHLLRRIQEAWSHRREPELLLAKSAAPVNTDGAAAPVGDHERTGMLVVGLGSVIALASLLMTWGKGSGLLSGHARTTDLDLSGRSFNGIAAEGGTWFGLMVLGFAAFALAGAVVTLRSPGRGGRFLSPDGALIGSMAALAAALGYYFTSPSDLAVNYSNGPGSLLAAGGALVAIAGSAWAVKHAPFAPLKPLRAEIAWGRIIGALVGLAIVVIGLVSGWTFDKRAESVVSPELQERIAELRSAAEDNPALEAANASTIASLMSEARRDPIVTNAWDGEGSGLGAFTLALVILAAAAVLPAAGLFGGNEEMWWRWSVVAVGGGLAVTVVGLGWITSLLRVADPGLVSGAGAFLTVVGGFLISASSRGLVATFARRRVYQDVENLTSDLGTDAEGYRGAQAHEPEGAVSG